MELRGSSSLVSHTHLAQVYDPNLTLDFHRIYRYDNPQLSRVAIVRPLSIQVYLSGVVR